MSDGAGFRVTLVDTGEIVFRKWIDMSGLSDGQAAARMQRQRLVLKLRYWQPKYKLEEGFFGSESAFDHFLPGRSENQNS